jgi:chemotaxis protein MotA
MDKLSFIGLLFAFGSIVIGQWLSGGTLSVLLNGHAFVIVVGGTFGAVMLQSPFRHFKAAFSRVAWVFFPPERSLSQLSAQVQTWAHLVRQHGFLVLEEQLEDLDDPFCHKGLTLLIDGADGESLRQILEQHIDIEQEDLERSARVFEAMGGYSPTIGIIGAVLGLIQAMSFLATPEQLGGGIAVAFVATIYGVGFANFVYLPVANKLRSVFYHYAVYQEMVLAGLVSIADGENSLGLERRMSSFVQEQS